MYNFFKGLLRAELATPLVSNQNKYIKPHIVNKLGKKNKKKIFYIIKKNFQPNGLFSNLSFVLYHLDYALKKKYLPIVDMQNFPTIYNEKQAISGTKNSWDYFFYPLSNYNLDDVYKSAKVIFSSDSIPVFFVNHQPRFKILLKKKIKIQSKILSLFKKKKKLYFGRNRIMGVHVRGTLQRIVKGHSLPPNPQDFLNEAIKIFTKSKCDKIFLVTEDLIYLNSFRNYFKDKLIYLNTPRSDPKIFGSHNYHFTKYNRKYHRYKLGVEVLIDALLLSTTKTFLFTDSNVWRFASMLASKKQKKYHFITKFNSNNKFFARWKWYFHNYLYLLFGKVDYKIKKID